MTRLLAALLLLSVAAGAATIESLRAGAAADFAQSPAALGAAFLQPALRPRAAASFAGQELGRMDLAGQLDQNLNLLSMTLGGRARIVGIATDSQRKKYFLTFAADGAILFSDLGQSFKQVLHEGIQINPDASTAYNLRVKANIFDPVRGSVFYLTPLAGTTGPSYSDKTAVVYDAIRAHATKITIGGSEYLFAYGRDALPDGSGFAATRTFLIIHEAGLGTKAFPLAEDSLPLNTPSVVDLKDVRVELTRTADSLIVRSTN